MITCDQCKESKCCKDVTVEIDEPTDFEDWDEIRWMVAHQNVAVYLDNDDDWVVEFRTPCSKLNKDGKCKIYNKKPKTCSEHELDSCVMNGEGEPEKLRFDTVEQVEEYFERKIKPKLIKNFKKDMDEIGNYKWTE